MPENPDALEGPRRKADAYRERVREARGSLEETAAFYAEFSDNELVAFKGGRVDFEMSRRLIASNGELRDAIDGFRDSAEKSSRQLVFLTWALVALTAVLVVLTFFLIKDAFDEPGVHSPSRPASPSTAARAVSSEVCPYTSPVIAMEL